MAAVPSAAAERVDDDERGIVHRLMNSGPYVGGGIHSLGALRWLRYTGVNDRADEDRALTPILRRW